MGGGTAGAVDDGRDDPSWIAPGVPGCIGSELPLPNAKPGCIGAAGWLGPIESEASSSRSESSGAGAADDDAGAAVEGAGTLKSSKSIRFGAAAAREAAAVRWDGESLNRQLDSTQASTHAGSISTVAVRSPAKYAS